MDAPLHASALERFRHVIGCGHVSGLHMRRLTCRARMLSELGARLRPPPTEPLAAALHASRRCPVFMAFRSRLIAAGKPVKAAITATARKLLSVVNAMLANGVDYREVSQTRIQLPANPERFRSSFQVRLSLQPNPTGRSPITTLPTKPTLRYSAIKSARTVGSPRVEQHHQGA